MLDTITARRVLWVGCNGERSGVAAQRNNYCRFGTKPDDSKAQLAETLEAKLKVYVEVGCGVIGGATDAADLWVLGASPSVLAGSAGEKELG